MYFKIANQITHCQFTDIIDSIKNGETEIHIGDLIIIKSYVSKIIGDDDIINPRTFTKDFVAIKKFNELEQQKNDALDKLYNQIKDKPEVLQAFNAWIEDGANVPFYKICVYRKKSRNNVLLKQIDNIKPEEVKDKFIQILNEFNIEIIKSA